MNRHLPRVVVDTNLFVSALFVGTPAARQILHRILSRAVVCFCPETFAELEAKSRLIKFDRYTRQEDRTEAVDAFGKTGLFITVAERVRICRDPKDDIFLSLAKTVSADAIISGDKDLVVLREFEGIPIFTPREWCAHLNEGQA